MVDNTKYKNMNIVTGISISVPSFMSSFHPPNLNCDSENVVYLLFCNSCDNGVYIGETRTHFRLRFNNHKKSIRDNSRGFPVAEHFNLPNHSLLNLKCVLLASNFRSDSERKISEIQFILRFKTHINGLNKDLGPLNHYTFYKHP